MWVTFVKLLTLDNSVRVFFFMQSGLSLKNFLYGNSHYKILSRRPGGVWERLLSGRISTLGRSFLMEGPLYNVWASLNTVNFGIKKVMQRKIMMNIYFPEWVQKKPFSCSLLIDTWWCSLPVSNVLVVDRARCSPCSLDWKAWLRLF